MPLGLALNMRALFRQYTLFVQLIYYNKKKLVAFIRFTIKN